MNEEQYAEISASLAANEVEHKSFRRRLDETEALLKEQNKIVLAVEKQSSAIQSMNNSMERVEKKLDGVSGRVEALEKEPGDNWKKAKWEIIKYILLALVGLVVGWMLNSATAAKAEAVPSATVQGLYKIESDGMRLSDAPVRVTIIDLAVVDIDSAVLNAAGQIVAKVYFPFVPDDGIEGIVMFDGWHLASGQFIRAGENAIIVTFRADDLREFDGTVGLYLILVGHTEE